MSDRGNIINHIADRYIGIPVLFTLSLFFGKKKDKPETVRRIAIIRTAAIGDTVLLSAICQDLKHRYPLSELTFITGPSNAGMASLMPKAVDKVVKLPVTNVIASLRQIRQLGYFDLIFDTGQWPRLDALYAVACRGYYRIGFKTPNQFKHYCFNEAIPHSDQVHEIENFRNLIRPFTGEISFEKPYLTIKPSEKVSEIMQKTGPLVVIHPWPGGANSWTKEWPTQAWCDFAQRIVGQGFTIAVTGAPADIIPTNKLLEQAQLGDRMINLSGKLSLAETADLVRNAQAFISVNTGIMHIGSALNVPMIALHGPTSPLRWGPLSERSIAIQPGGNDCGYLNLGFEYKGNPTDCMSRIDVKEVWNAFCSIAQLHKC